MRSPGSGAAGLFPDSPGALPAPKLDELVRAPEVERQGKLSQYDLMALDSLAEHVGKRLQFMTYAGTDHHHLHSWRAAKSL